MYEGYIKSVRAGFENESLAIELADVSWREGENLVNYGSSHTLGFRICPREVGVEYVLANGRYAPMGSLMFFPQGSIAKSRATATEHARALICCFTDRWTRQTFGQDTNYSNFSEERGADVPRFEISAYLKRVVIELERPGFASEILIESLISAAAVELNREFGNKTDDQATVLDRAQLSRKQVKTIIDLIAAHGSASILVAQISTEIGMSSSHLRRTFKNTIGITLREYIQNYRMERSMELLKDSDLPLKQVAHRLGFGSATAFAYAFKRIAGCSPNSYRELRRF